MAKKLNYNIPNGATFALASGFGAETNVTSISNATEAVVKLTAADATIKAGDFVQIFSAWTNLDAYVAKVKSVDATANTVTLAEVDTSNTDIFPAGGGAGTIRRISGWTDLPYITTIANAGNEQQTTSFQAIQMEQARNLNTFKSAASQTFTMTHNATDPIRKTLEALDASQDITAYKMYNKNSKETRVYGCQVSFNTLPATAVNEVETCQLVLNLQSKMKIYSAAA